MPNNSNPVDRIKSNSNIQQKTSETTSEYIQRVANIYEIDEGLSTEVKSEIQKVIYAKSSKNVNYEAIEDFIQLIQSERPNTPSQSSTTNGSDSHEDTTENQTTTVDVPNQTDAKIEANNQTKNITISDNNKSSPTNAEEYTKNSYTKSVSRTDRLTRAEQFIRPDGNANITTKHRTKFICVSLVLVSFTTYLFAAESWNTANQTNRSVFSLLIQWDSGWYLRTIDSGYQTSPILSGGLAGQANWAFFPLYPLAVKLVTYIGLSAKHSGIILSNVFLAIALYYIYQYLSETRDDHTAMTGVVLFALGPYSFYFSTVYTEALFIMLSAMGFYYIYQEKWFVCGIIGALLSATRGYGAVFGIALLLGMLIRSYEDEKGLLETSKSIIFDGKKVLSLGLVPFGLSLYMLYLYSLVGDALAFAHVQKAWGRSFGNPILVLWNGVTSGSFNPQYLAIAGIIGFVSAGYLIYKQRYIEGVFGLLLLSLPISSGINSIPRYIVGSLVLVYAINDVINIKENFRWLIVGILCLINFRLLWLWYDGASLVN